MNTLKQRNPWGLKALISPQAAIIKEINVDRTPRTANKVVFCSLFIYLISKFCSNKARGFLLDGTILL